jgi:uncharacterized membrane protein YgdD (TMEM256/DUF423 family)
MDGQKFFLRKAGLSGLLAVGFGAFAAHGLKGRLATLPPEEAAKLLDWMRTGAHYQLAHACALLALAALPANLDPDKLMRAGSYLFSGSLIFSGCLYAMALGGPLWLGAVVPAGGVLMLLGWGNLFWLGWRQ